MPKLATSCVAAFPDRQTKTTSSVRALPQPSKPTAKPGPSAKPVVTKAGASQPRVVLPPPVQQPGSALIGPRTAKSVPALAKTTLPRSSTDDPRHRPPTVKSPLVGDDFMKTINAGLKRAKVNMRMEECVNLPQPYFIRDPFSHSVKVLTDCRWYKSGAKRAKIETAKTRRSMSANLSSCLTT